MKTLYKAIAVASLATTGVAQALEGSIGAMNEYVFRGETLATDGIYAASAGTNVAGLDVGIALVDADGYFERNLMAGYTMNIAGVDVDLGYTDYSYGENDDTETEVSIGMTASGVTITYVDGEDNDVDAQGVETTADYTVLSFGYSVGGMDITVGSKEVDGGAEYNYYEISTGTEIAGLDATVTLTNSFSEEGTDWDGNGAVTQDARIVVGVSKALSL